MEDVRIPVGDAFVSASVHGGGSTALVLGHGAGGNRQTPSLVRLAQALAVSGRLVLLFNFPYTEQRRRVPDRPEVLEATVRAVGDHAGALPGVRRVVHGGRSMGGRIASQAVAKGASADALVFLGYPLHPPGRPERLRDGHLGGIGVPMLFVQGTRDAFGRWDLVESLLKRLGARATLHAVPEGDHSFSVPKRSGKTNAAVEAGMIRGIVAWLTDCGL